MSSHVDWHIKMTEQTNLLNIMKTNHLASKPIEFFNSLKLDFLAFQGQSKGKKYGEYKN